MTTDTLSPSTEEGYTVATGKRVELYIGPGLTRLLDGHPRKLSPVANAAADRYAEIIEQECLPLVPEAMLRVKSLLPPDRMISAQEIHGLPGIAAARFGKTDPFSVMMSNVSYATLVSIVDAAERLS